MQMDEEIVRAREENRILRAKIKEQHKVYTEEKYKLIARGRSLQEAIQEEQKRSQEDFDEYSRRLRALEEAFSARQVQAVTLPGKIPQIQQYSPHNFTERIRDLEDEGEKIAAETERIILSRKTITQKTIQAAKPVNPPTKVAEKPVIEVETEKKKNVEDLVKESDFLPSETSSIANQQPLPKAKEAKTIAPVAQEPKIMANASELKPTPAPRDAQQPKQVFITVAKDNKVMTPFDSDVLQSEQFGIDINTDGNQNQKPTKKRSAKDSTKNSEDFGLNLDIGGDPFEFQ